MSFSVRLLSFFPLFTRIWCFLNLIFAHPSLVQMRVSGQHSAVHQLTNRTSSTVRPRWMDEWMDHSHISKMIRAKKKEQADEFNETNCLRLPGKTLFSAQSHQCNFLRSLSHSVWTFDQTKLVSLYALYVTVERRIQTSFALFQTVFVLIFSFFFRSLQFPLSV